MGDKGSLPLIPIFDPDVIVSPSDIKLGIDLGIFNFVNEVRD